MNAYTDGEHLTAFVGVFRDPEQFLGALNCRAGVVLSRKQGKI